MKRYIKSAVSYYKDESDIAVANTLIRDAVELLRQYLMTESDLKRFLRYDRIHDEYVLDSRNRDNLINSFNEFMKEQGNSDGYLFIGYCEMSSTDTWYFPVYFKNCGEDFSVGTFVIGTPDYRDDGSAAEFYFKSWRGAKINRTYTLGWQYVGEDDRQIRQL